MAELAAAVRRRDFQKLAKISVQISCGHTLVMNARELRLAHPNTRASSCSTTSHILTANQSHNHTSTEHTAHTATITKTNTLRHRVTETHKCTDPQTHIDTYVQTHKHTNTQTDTQPRPQTATQPRSYTATQPIFGNDVRGHSEAWTQLVCE